MSEPILRLIQDLKGGGEIAVNSNGTTIIARQPYDMWEIELKDLQALAQLATDMHNQLQTIVETHPLTQTKPCPKP
jgi:hypothetical protein